jgi:hypothetical protein
MRVENTLSVSVRWGLKEYPHYCFAPGWLVSLWSAWNEAFIFQCIYNIDFAETYLDWELRSLSYINNMQFCCNNVHGSLLVNYFSSAELLLITNGCWFISKMILKQAYIIFRLHWLLKFLDEISKQMAEESFTVHNGFLGSSLTTASLLSVVTLPDLPSRFLISSIITIPKYRLKFLWLVEIQFPFLPCRQAFASQFPCENRRDGIQTRDGD